MTEADVGNNQNGNGRKFLLRPEREFLQLPVKFRWEATRRHPYYLRFWRIASRPDPLGPLEAQARDAARLLLKAVNVGGVPADPALPFEKLDESPVGRAFLGGSLAPLTLRGCVAPLAYALDSATLKQVAQGLFEIAQLDRTDRDVFHPALERLLKLPLDSIPNDGIVSFNPHHPARAIIDDMQRHVAEVKERHGIKESRRRHEKFPLYFEVWDAREGWTGSGYDRQKERPLTKVSKALKRPLKTVSDQYRSAFEVIFGTPYSPDLWMQLVLPLKFVGTNGLLDLPRVGRPLRVRTPRPVPESVLEGPNDHGSLLKLAGVSDGEIEFSDLKMDITSMIATGASDTEICDALELGSGSLDLIAYFRQRSAERP